MLVGRLQRSLIRNHDGIRTWGPWVDAGCLIRIWATRWSRVTRAAARRAWRTRRLCGRQRPVFCSSRRRWRLYLVSCGDRNLIGRDSTRHASSTLFNKSFLFLFYGDHGADLFDCRRVITLDSETHDDWRYGSGIALIQDRADISVERLGSTTDGDAALF